MIPERIPVENEPMVRDRRTGALLSTDRDAIRAYEARKRERLSQQERINTLERTVAELQKAISEITEKR
jgi:hypothetical protein